MPNYNITIDSRFDPYSFEDYLKPLAILQEQHNQAADAYATALAGSAGMEEALAANPDDIDLLNQYNAYRQTLNNLADDLSKNGISRTTRRGAYQAKADYGNIAKMQEAIKQRDEILKERRDLRKADPSLIFSNDDLDYSIRNVMAGNTNYDMLSKDKVKASVKDALKKWADSAYIQAMEHNNPEATAQYGYIFTLLENGAKPWQIEQAVREKYPTSPVAKELRNVLNSVVDEYTSASQEYDENGNLVSTWRNKIGDIENAASLGLYEALGTMKLDHMQDLTNQYKTSKAGKTEAFVGADYDILQGIRADGPDLWGNDTNKVAVINGINNVLKGKNFEDLNVGELRQLASQLPLTTINKGDWNFDNFLNSEENGLDLNKEEKEFLRSLWGKILNVSANKEMTASGQESVKESVADLEALLDVMNENYDNASKHNIGNPDSAFGYAAKLPKGFGFNNNSGSLSEYRNKAKKVTDQLGDILERYKNWATGNITVTDMIQFSNVDDGIVDALYNKVNVSGDGSNFREFKGQNQKGEIVKGNVIPKDDVKELFERSMKSRADVSRAVNLVSDKDGNPSIMVTFVDNKKEKTYHVLMPALTGSNNPLNEQGKPVDLVDEQGNPVLDDNGKQIKSPQTIFQNWMKAQRDWRKMMTNKNTLDLINSYQEGTNTSEEAKKTYLKYINTYSELDGYSKIIPTAFLNYFADQQQTKETSSKKRGYIETTKD